LPTNYETTRYFPSGDDRNLLSGNKDRSGGLALLEKGAEIVVLKKGHKEVRFIREELNRCSALK
jgi:hypothetical protein